MNTSLRIQRLSANIQMMSMLNHAAVEALCSATYLENYLDCMDSLPDDLQRVVTQLRELDSTTNELVSDILHQKDIYVNHEDGAQKKKALINIQRKLIRSQELGDEKLALVSSIIEHVENRTRQLEQDLENLDPGTTQPAKEQEEPIKIVTTPSVAKTPKQTPAAAVTVAPPAPVHTAPVVTFVEEKTETPSLTKTKRQRRQRTQDNTKEEEKKTEEEEKPKKKKKRKVKKEKIGDKSPIDPPIDPDEPTYCLCEQVSYGEMIGCDNEKCEIEWFHFNCVDLQHKPKGKWFCPKCRGDKPTILRPDLLEALKREKAKGN